MTKWITAWHGLVAARTLMLSMLNTTGNVRVERCASPGHMENNRVVVLACARHRKRCLRYPRLDNSYDQTFRIMTQSCLLLICLSEYHCRKSDRRSSSRVAGRHRENVRSRSVNLVGGRTLANVPTVSAATRPGCNLRRLQWNVTTRTE